MQRIIKVVAICFFVSLVVLNGNTIKAADHIDGSHSVANPQVDLTDLYAFVDETSPGQLTVILNIITAAQVWDRPDSDIGFEIAISPVSINANQKLFQTDLRNRYDLRCYWTKTAVNCLSSVGTKLSTNLNSENTNKGVRVFAGKRSDPFVLNGVWAAELAVNNKIPHPFRNNIIQNFNVYSIVAQLDLDTEIPFAQGNMLAIGGQARNLKTNKILDRIGRPEVANIVLQSNKGQDLRDDLNAQPALVLSEDLHRRILSRIRENLDRYDEMYPSPYEVNKDQLAAILADDYLIIDPKLSCSKAQYFDIEYALIAGKQAVSCGGRPLRQDIIDSVYGLMVTGNPKNKISDGANEPTKPVTDSFPYLAEPNTGAKALFYSVIGRIISDLSVSGEKRTMAALIGGLVLLVIFGMSLLGIRKLIRFVRS